MIELQRAQPKHSQERDALPSASVITVNTNEKHRLEVYLPSAFASRGNFEIIISDNGSTDGSLEWLEQEFPDACVLRNGKNIGFAAANNRAAEIANNEILVFVNPDTSVHPDWLYHLLQPFKDARVGLTTSKVLLMSNPEKINACGNTIHVSGLTLCRGMGRSKELYSAGDEVDAISGAAFAMRREVFEVLGGFDEDFFIYMEETDLSLRARLAGWKCVYVPQSVILHDYNLRFGPNKVHYQERNRYLMLLKNLKWRSLLVLLPAFLLAEVVTWGFVLLGDRQHWKNKFCAYRWIAVNWQDVMRKRKATQKLRKVSDRELLKNAGVRLDFGQVARGGIAYLADGIFTPLFFIVKRMMRAVVWW
ncbi:MAG TPA: glycosyltransferase family 2 protein [Pyrinomonadaceae bacterium]|nr:glycosyltransferase family 2 protein [Pyrinomonadaceae bacterium]